jgi:diguanylate cyclase (GGDEF)-like protein
MARLKQALSNFAPAQYLDFLQMGVLVVDQNYRVVYWNRWLEAHSNIQFTQIANLPFVEVFPNLAESRLYEVIHQAVDEGLSSLISASLNQSLLPLYPSINHQLKQMDFMHQMVQVTAIIDEEKKRYAMLQISDMTNALAKDAQLVEKTQTLLALNEVDDLTKVANRRKFDEVLTEEYRRALRANTTLVVGFVAVDHFDLFKDHYGKKYANQCLVEVAATFEYALNRSTDLVSRYDNQLFAVILPCTTFDGAVNVAEIVRNGVSDLQLRHKTSTVADYVTASVGFAIAHPTLQGQPEKIIESAMFALSQAKEAGGNKAMIYAMQDGSLHACDAAVNVKKMIEG